MTDIWVRQWFWERIVDTLLDMGVPFDRIAEQGMVFGDDNPLPTLELVGELKEECYYVPYYIISPPWANAIGKEAPNKYMGAYQLTVFAPLGVDELQIIQMLNPVAEAFKKGVQYSEEGFCIYCNQSYIAKSFRDKDKWQVVLRIKFKAVIEN